MPKGVGDLTGRCNLVQTRACQPNRKGVVMDGWFVAAFRTASENLRGGDRTATFPAGSFPPALPFVAG